MPRQGKRSWELSRVTPTKVLAVPSVCGLNEPTQAEHLTRCLAHRKAFKVTVVAFVILMLLLTDAKQRGL